MAFIRAQEEPYKSQITKTPLQEPESLGKYGTSIRLRLLLHYMHHVKLALQEGNMEPSVMKKDAFDRMIDAILLGSSSERIQGTYLTHRISRCSFHYIFLPTLLFFHL